VVTVDFRHISLLCHISFSVQSNFNAVLLLKLGMGKIYGLCHVLLVFTRTHNLQIQIIFRGAVPCFQIFVSSIKMFLCFVAVSGFCPNVGHFSQRYDNEHSAMQMKRCLKPDAGGWWLVQH